MRFFLTGHGGWKPKNGYFETPRNGTVKFFTQNAKLMIDRDVYALVSGAQEAEASQEVGPYRWCPNMTLWPDDDFQKPITDSSFKGGSLTKDGCVIRVPKPTLLANLIEFLMSRHAPKIAGGFEFWWCCCRELQVRETQETMYDPISNTFVPFDADDDDSAGFGIGPLQSQINAGDNNAKNSNMPDSTRFGMNVSEMTGSGGKVFSRNAERNFLPQTAVEMLSKNYQEFCTERDHKFGKVVVLKRKS